MSIVIKDIRIILPALVSFEQNGEESSLFVYIDQVKKDIVIPDTTGITDVEEFKKAFQKHYNLKNPIVPTPEIPKNIFNKVDPASFKGDYNG